MQSVLALSALAVVSTAVVWYGSDLLESSSEQLSEYYGLPPAVHGAVVVAIGSSFPELASVVLSTLDGSFGLGVGAIVGSAIFNILVIPAVSTLFANRLESSREVVYREAQFYMLSVAVFLLVFSFGVIYSPAPLSENGSLVTTITRPMALVPILLYGLYIFIQYQDTADYDSPTPDGNVNILKQWGLLAASLVIVLVSVEGLVHAAQGFAEVFGTPEYLWGLTVIAAGTSLPDTLVSVRAARDDRGVTSLANVLGSNIFDLLVAVPVGVLILGEATFDYGAAVPMMGFLTLATIVLFTTMRTDLELTDSEAGVLLTTYVLFVGWMVAETVGLTSFVPGI
ncbi:sodium:calcium antiporter [Haloprofundus marisrubri]|uniref:Sodium:calcium antiporter n=1 Tax=Haloprofundus marisrubri TaxID=1514971 RepID=A0A0W1RDU9_9EURY|nr:sodium:calcium antiporter [Haloprofundus marisrubri]KTG11293.1 sodium:calcium antiporter [Haloprofundus marisrubri]